MSEEENKDFLEKCVGGDRVDPYKHDPRQPYGKFVGAIVNSDFTSETLTQLLKEMKQFDDIRVVQPEAGKFFMGVKLADHHMWTLARFSGCIAGRMSAYWQPSKIIKRSIVAASWNRFWTNRGYIATVEQTEEKTDSERETEENNTEEKDENTIVGFQIWRSNFGITWHQYIDNTTQLTPEQIVEIRKHVAEKFTSFLHGTPRKRERTEALDEIRKKRRPKHS